VSAPVISFDPDLPEPVKPPVVGVITLFAAVILVAGIVGFIVMI